MNNDLISRSTLLDVMRYAIDDAPMYIAATVDQQITEAPAVDAEVVRHGRWRVVEDPTVVDGAGRPTKHIECTACGARWMAPEYASVFQRCYICGAKMDGGSK